MYGLLIPANVVYSNLQESRIVALSRSNPFWPLPENFGHA